MTRQANAFMLNTTLPQASASRQMSTKVIIVARGRKTATNDKEANRISRTSIIATFSTCKVAEKKPEY
jgi:hypothetical protein